MTIVSEGILGSQDHIQKSQLTIVNIDEFFVDEGTDRSGMIHVGIVITALVADLEYQSASRDRLGARSVTSSSGCADTGTRTRIGHY